MVNRDEVPPARCDLGHGALAERHFSITRTARKRNDHRAAICAITGVVSRPLFVKNAVPAEGR